MKRWLIVGALCGTAVLAGCGRAVISEISDSSLTVQSNQAAETEAVRA